MELFSLDKRKLRGNLINMYEYLVGGIRKIHIQIFSVVICERTRSKRHKLKYREFYLDFIRENFFIVWLSTDYGNSCPECLRNLHPWRYSKAT